MSNQKNEVIKLSLPINAAYVSAARLTASSIANRMNFDIDETEDVKAAVSEACTFIINNTATHDNNQFKIIFELGSGVLIIRIEVKDSKASLENNNEELGFIMIKALMDEFQVTDADSALQIKMVKRHKEVFL